MHPTGSRPGRLTSRFSPHSRKPRKMVTADIAIPRTQNVEEVLREGGLSPFHRKAILVTGAAWTFVAMEILLVGFVAPIFAGLWNLDGRMQWLVNSAALAGSLCGSLGRGLVAGRAARGDRAVVRLPRADLRPLRRLELALPVPRGGLPCLPRVRCAKDAAREPVLPRAARPLGRSGGGAERDHRPPGRGGGVRRPRGAALVGARPLRGAAARPRRDDGADLDCPEHLVLRAVPLAAVRAAGGEGLPRRRLPPADCERAFAVPRVRGGDLARRASRPKADAGYVPPAWRRVSLRIRGGRLPGRVRDRAGLRRLLQPRRVGGGVPVHVGVVPDPTALERLRPDGGRRQGGGDRRAVHLRQPE